MKTLFKISLFFIFWISYIKEVNAQIKEVNEVKTSADMTFVYKVWAKNTNTIVAWNEKFYRKQALLDYFVAAINNQELILNYFGSTSNSHELAQSLFNALETSRFVLYKSEDIYIYVEVYRINNNGKIRPITNKEWKRYMEQREQE